MNIVHSIRPAYKVNARILVVSLAPVASMRYVDPITTVPSALAFTIKLAILESSVRLRSLLMKFVLNALRPSLVRLVSYVAIITASLTAVHKIRLVIREKYANGANAFSDVDATQIARLTKRASMRDARIHAKYKTLVESTHNVDPLYIVRSAPVYLVLKVIHTITVLNPRFAFHLLNARVTRSVCLAKYANFNIVSKDAGATRTAPTIVLATAESAKILVFNPMLVVKGQNVSQFPIDQFALVLQV